jgi:saccharopine dehydrogenase-like NADP-dependent oxidoreductase
MKIAVLGAGLVGAPMARDLACEEGFAVTVADISANALQSLSSIQGITCIETDLSVAANVRSVIRDADLVLSAVPGFMGFDTLKTTIEEGKNAVDIAFFPEDLFELDDLARKYNATIISDMGVAPGMSNLLTGYAVSMLEKTKRVRIYVGGLPKVREWPWEYKAVFSPSDVIEEYTRPARYVENGRIVIKPALTDPELMDFPHIGTLEAFNSDGLRTLMATIDAPDMIEKTLRYPGHIEKIKVLRDMGLFEQEPLNINGQWIRPLEFTSRLLFPKWKLKEGEEDITVMQVIVDGTKNGQSVTYRWDLFDTYDNRTGVHSMARTTGYTATMAVRMLAGGLYKEKGVSPPEYIGKDHNCVEFILKGLKDRGIHYELAFFNSPD